MMRWLVALLPLLTLGVLAAVTWPGYISFDAAYQWYQARTGDYATVSPPQWPALWSLMLAVGLPATSGPILLIVGLHAFGFGYVAFTALQRGHALSAWLVALLGPVCPLLLLLIPHIWTDLVLSGALLSASALLIARPTGWLRHCAILLLLLLASAVRHNGIFAVLPLVVWWMWLSLPTRPLRQHIAAAGVILAGLWVLNASLHAGLSDQQADTWAVAPMFDLQAVSVATSQQLLPASLVGEGMDVAQLHTAFHPYSSTRLFSSTTSGVFNPTAGPLSDEQHAALRDAWLSMPAQSAWWAHRWRLFSALLGPHRGDLLSGLADSPAIVSHAGNPVLQRRSPAAHAHYRSVVESSRGSWLFAPGLYLLLGVAAAWLACRPSLANGVGQSHWRLGVLALLASAWAYTLPYFLLAPSAETRYLIWPALASWLLTLLVAGSFASRFVPQSDSKADRSAI